MRIVLVAGEPAFRYGVKVALEESADLQLVAEASDARTGFLAVDSQRPDVLVMDVALRGMNGIDATREVKRRAPGTRVLLIASWPRERDMLDGFAAGAHGFALKTDPIDSLRQAIRTVGQGGRYLPEEARGLDLRGGSDGRRTPAAVVLQDVLEVLSAREREVLDLVVKGCRNREIARELCISIKTVDTHRTHINRKLHCASGADLIRFAADNDLLRRAPSHEGGDQPSRTMMLVTDDDGWRDDVLRALAAEGYHQARASSASRAMDELRQAPAASVFIIDPGAAGQQPAVRAVASLPAGDAGDAFVAALDRAAALRRAERGADRRPS